METRNRGEVLLGRIASVVRQTLPAEVSPAYFDDFLERHWHALVAVLDDALDRRDGAPGAPSAQASGPAGVLPELWSPGQRTEANLKAMTLLASKPVEAMTEADRSVLARYSGWGGLSLQKVAHRFPPGFPVPEARGLVHEYYTPTRVWKAVADALRPRMRDLLTEERTPGLFVQRERARALEPSAGIGRALRGFEGWPLDWTAVEYSAVSARLLAALFPQATVHAGPFEGWVAENPANHPSRQFDLVVSNPPYGARGSAAELDPDPGVKTSRAYLYFMARTLGLLRRGGIGAYIVPTGWLTSRSPEMRRFREHVLKRAHLMAAFRLPSQAPPGGSIADVVYDQFVVDLLLFRSRGGALASPVPSDVPVLEGGYFEAFPDHVLGTPVGLDEGWEPGKPKPRRGFQLVGRFEGLPPFTERPLEDGAVATAGERRIAPARGGITREERTVEGLAPELDAAVVLGTRADAFLAAVASGDPAAPAAWSELHRDLLAWRVRWGNPRHHKGLAALSQGRITGAQRFLALWTPGGELVEALGTAPVVEARYRGEWTLPAVADWCFRQQGQLSVAALQDFWRTHVKAPLSREDIEAQLLPAGWCLDGEAWETLLPDGVYYTGLLWPRFDRARERADDGDAHAARQLARLRETIGWRSGPNILAECAPIDSWLPLDLVGEFAADCASSGGLALKRSDGLLMPAGVRPESYHLLNNTDKGRTSGFTRDLLCFIGWANLDVGLWRPEREKIPDPETGEEKFEPMEEARRKQQAAWTAAWRKWVAEDGDRTDRLELAYNRGLRGYLPPTYSAEPVPILRWNGELRLHDYQTRAARKLLANRSGLLAFDVGLGKTYTGLATIAAARQEGWARRPVVLVPNSIVWKWARDFKRALPDYRVLVIGSKRALATRGSRAGRMVAVVDTPAERAEKWTTFQAGGADVVLLTYGALPRTQMDAKFVERYVAKTVALRRSIVMSLEAEDGGKADKSDAEPTERNAATMQERIRGWVGRMLAPPKGQAYDPGIDWHALGVDFLLVDEAQNFKNLFYSQREGGDKKDTKRAWALDFRCASVREHSGGAGVILLSATPAKNSPVEFYTMLHYLRPDLWGQVGVDNHEAFVQRFGHFQNRQVPDAGGQKIKEREVFTRFQNLDELRDVVFRWAEFKVAEEVGLKLPQVERRNHQVEVTDAMAEALSDLYSELANVEEQIIRAAAQKKDPAKFKALLNVKLGIALKIYLTYLHPLLPGLSAADRKKAVPTDGPKLVKCADEILATADRACPKDGDEGWCLDCAHIVFCDNIAVHGWMRELLVARGLPRERIAILNAEEAADTELRQQIVEGFNGVGAPEDDEYTPPKYDVVIANAVAYEGMDLQRRTCAIHHLDVPWEPATLQQRNGRGVRQGNLFSKVTLHYYFVKGSNEIHRIDRIERKRGWMSSLVAAQARNTNTTQEEDLDEGDVEDLALAHAPPEVRDRIMRARREQEAQLKVQKRKEAQEQANRELGQVDLLFRRADREPDAERAGQLRAEAEGALARLGRFPADLWPFDWHGRAAGVREGRLYIPRRGPPLRAGDVIGIEGSVYKVGRHGFKENIAYRMKRHTLGVAREVEGVWLVRSKRAAPVDFLEIDRDLMEEASEAELELDADGWEVASADEVRRQFTVNHAYRWPAQGWTRLPAELQVGWWPGVAPGASQMLLGAYGPGQEAVPLTTGRGALVVVSEGRPADRGALLAPTEEGWARFVGLAADADVKWGELQLAAKFWWGRSLPRRVGADTREAA